MLKGGPDPFVIAKLLIGIATLNYAIAPLFADLNSTRVFHPEWRARSKLPMVWLFRAKFHYRCCVVVDMAKRPGVAGRHSGLVCGGGFRIAASTQGLYGGVLTDSGRRDRIR